MEKMEWSVFAKLHLNWGQKDIQNEMPELIKMRGWTKRGVKDTKRFASQQNSDIR